jgi:hypothetical protein
MKRILFFLSMMVLLPGLNLVNYVSTSTILEKSTPTPGSSNRTPTYPTGYFEDYKESDCGGTPPEMNKCISGKAHESARELDKYLQELDLYFPNGSWEKAIERMAMPQEKWESLKEPYCEFREQDSIGGTGHSAFIMGCINEQNIERIKTFNFLVCLQTRGFPRCTKMNVEIPEITAIPVSTPSK